MHLSKTRCRSKTVVIAAAETGLCLQHTRTRYGGRTTLRTSFKTQIIFTESTRNTSPWAHHRTNTLTISWGKRAGLLLLQEQYSSRSQPRIANSLARRCWTGARPRKQPLSAIFPDPPTANVPRQARDRRFALPQKASHGRGQELVRVGAVAGDGLAWFCRRPYPFPVQQGRLASLLKLAVEVELRARRMAKNRSGHQSFGKFCTPEKTCITVVLPVYMHALYIPRESC